MTPTGADVAVIGGGIIGTATAAMLAAAGVRVTLYERAPDVAAGASGRNAGEICRPPDPVLGPLFTESLRRYREVVGERLADGTVFTIPGSPIGVLEVAFDSDLVRRAAAALAAIQPDLPPEVIDGPALRDLEPHLVDGITAYRVDTGYPVRPADATRAFATIARRAGASIVTGAEARPWIEDGVARGLLVGDRRVPADWVVVAAGPWSPALIDPTGRWQPIRASWGVIVEMDLPRPPRHVMGELMADGSAMLSAPPAPAGSGGSGPELPKPVLGVNPAPARSGGGAAPVSLGGTLAAVEPDPVRVAPTLVDHARRFLPALDERQMGAIRACARPQSFDGRPLIGLVPGIERLVIAAGNGAWGISTGPATARLAADVVLTSSDSAVPAALSAARAGAPPPR